MRSIFVLSFMVLAMFVSARGEQRLTVGPRDADIIGTDNKALQIAVDALWARGGGTVVIKPGVYRMFNSLRLRSHVNVIGEGEGVILKKEPMIKAYLASDCGYANKEVDLKEDPGFEVGMGFSVEDDKFNSGWGVTVGTIVGKEGKTLFVDTPMVWDYLLARNAVIKSCYSVVSGIDVEDIKLENIIADGSKETNDYLNGCVGGAIYFKNARNITIKNCVARNWNGDGVSYQIDQDVRVIGCQVYNNTGHGIHPGTGSARTVIRGNDSHHNGQDGLFLCWRVRHGVIEDNDLHHNRHGISIGHKDTDNVFSGNLIRDNRLSGVYFRDEDEPQGGHRNKFIKNVVVDNGSEKEACGFLIAGETHDIVIEDNTIGDSGKGCQKTGVRISRKACKVTVRNNKFMGMPGKPIEDKSKKGGNTLKPNEVTKEKVKY